MELLIFQTDIKSKEKVKHLEPVFNTHSGILNWSVDLEDIDNVLRIEAKNNVTEKDVIGLVETYGFHIETLAD